MPFGGPYLSTEEFACVQAWVDSVVADAGPPGSAATDGGVVDAAGTGNSGADASQTAPDSSAADASQTVPDSSAAPDSGPVDSGKGPSDTGSTPTFTEVYTTIFASATNGCTTHHSGAMPSGGLDLSTQAKAYTDLVGVKATTPNGENPACSGDLVVKGSAATSLLYEKVSETKPPCGVQMPKGVAPLTTAEQTMIEDWINGGALND